jgi:hypothetical protein
MSPPVNPWPPGYETRLVTGQFNDLGGNPLHQNLVWEGTTELVDQVNDRIIAPFRVPFKLDLDGSFAHYMLACDAPNLIPKNWHYNVYFAYPGGMTKEIFVPMGVGPLDISDLIPIPADMDPNVQYATVQMLEDEKADRAAGDALLVPLSQKGAPMGVATLDGTGKVPLSQLAGGTYFTPIEFSQAIPSSLWTITHPYPYDPAVTILNNAREQVEATVAYPTSSTVTINFAHAETGSALLQ